MYASCPEFVLQEIRRVKESLSPSEAQKQKSLYEGFRRHATQNPTQAIGTFCLTTEREVERLVLTTLGTSLVEV